MSIHRKKACLSSPPHGGNLRQPWRALSMSRATWYRHNKPTEKIERKTERDGAAFMGMSLRTFQRLKRVLESPRGEILIASGLTSSQAEQMLSDPERVERFVELFEHFNK
jgi:hypothetical protein